MKKNLLVIFSAFIACFLFYYFMPSYTQASNIPNHSEYYYTENSSLNEDGSYMSYVPTTYTGLGENAIDNSIANDEIHVLVNKEYALSSDYIPKDLVVPDVLFEISHYDEKKLMVQEAASALEELFDAAFEEGFTLYGISGYRSYNRQDEIYSTNLETKGEEYTNRYSAKPGCSEHQTGLVMDISCTSIGNKLEPVFAYTPEGKWLSNNAHKFGYIIRYPKDKEYITCYSYEPWHIRYIGKDLSLELFEQNMTLDEYYGYTPSISFSQDTTYDNFVDVDNSTNMIEVHEPTQTEIDRHNTNNQDDLITKEE